jgi:hypothetical protein
VTPSVVAIAATVYWPERYSFLGHLELVSGHHRRAAAVAAAGPSGGQPGGGAFADQVAFELGQGREQMEDELAARGGGIDRFLETPETDAAVAEAGDGIDQVAQGATQPIKPPHHKGVARTKLVQELLEAEPCDNAGCATLISDMGSGRMLAALWRGSGAPHDGVVWGFLVRLLDPLTEVA